MKTVELTFRYTQDEYVKAHRQYLFASKTITKTSVIILAIYLPIVIFYLFLSSFHLLGIIAVLIGLVALVIGCVLYFYIPVHQFKETLKYQEEYNLVFTNDNINFKTPTINTILNWDIYSEVWESNDFYFLIQAPRIYALIPKRAFTNVLMKQAFEEMVSSNLNRSK